MHTYFISTAPYLEDLLEKELQDYGADSLKPARLGVEATGDIAFAYKTCLWSRLANRVLLQIHQSHIQSADELYDACYQIDWLAHLSHNSTFWIDFIGQGAGINNTIFGAQKVKDALVDCIRDKTEKRPSIDKEEPDVCISVHLRNELLSVYIDLSGESLHKRGYRSEAGFAPIKENLAAAILYRCHWPMLAAEGKPLVDPLCGSGTFVIEALMMAADIAPGLFREYFGFLGWKQHDINVWKTIFAEAEARKEAGINKTLPLIYGYDADASVISKAKYAVKNLGLGNMIKFHIADLAHWHHDEALVEPGLIVTNPPYGHRLGNVANLPFFYKQLATKVKDEFKGWQFAMITSEESLVKATRLSPTKKYKFKNGNLDCQLFCFDIYAQTATQETAIQHSKVHELTEGAEMVANRIQKNLKKLKSWLKSQDINCYRVYDADIPEYAAAIDYYHGYLHIQEYAPPKTVDEQKAKQRFMDIIFAVQHVFECGSNKIFVKQRAIQKGNQQYQKQNKTHKYIEVKEYQSLFLVNLADYLDTGLFLDHRPVRRMISEMAKAKHFLNLFCYTATASVQAAMSGAKSTTSVDLSPTYTEWAQKNFALNGLNDYKNQVVQDDCFAWLKQNEKKFDLILLDPPTFSNSKRTNSTLDIQRDHVALIKLAMRSLTPNGLLIFSNNYRRFKLDEEALSEFRIEDVSAKTIDPDFERNSRIHQCWLVRY